jgi:hypothetical protein
VSPGLDESPSAREIGLGNRGSAGLRGQERRQPTDLRQEGQHIGRGRLPPASVGLDWAKVPSAQGGNGPTGDANRSRTLPKGINELAKDALVVVLRGDRRNGFRKVHVITPRDARTKARDSR